MKRLYKFMAVALLAAFLPVAAMAGSPRDLGAGKSIFEFPVLPSNYTVGTSDATIYWSNQNRSFYRVNPNGTAGVEQTGFSEWTGLASNLIRSAGTWTMTRIAQGNYAYVKTAAADVSVLGMDITPYLRTQAARGFKLTSFDVVYNIATAPLNTHTVTLDQVCFTDAVVGAQVTSIPLTGATISSANSTQVFVKTVTVTTPAYLNLRDCRYSVEVNVNAQASSVYTFYGINLNYSRN